jgi:hypothetical protein
VTGLRPPALILRAAPEAVPLLAAVEWEGWSKGSASKPIRRGEDRNEVGRARSELFPRFYARGSAIFEILATCQTADLSALRAAGVLSDKKDGTVLASTQMAGEQVGQQEGAHMGRVEWIKLEIGAGSSEVLRWRACKDYSDQILRASIARAAMDEMWDFPATGPERKLGALFADGIRFLDENRQVVWQLTYEEVWKERRWN